MAITANISRIEKETQRRAGSQVIASRVASAQIHGKHVLFEIKQQLLVTRGDKIQ
jgi:hypothetical protein